MVGKPQNVLVTVALAAVVVWGPPACQAQNQLPAAPVPLAPPSPVAPPATTPPSSNPASPGSVLTLPAPVYVPGNSGPIPPPPGGLAPPPPGGYFQDRNGPLLKGDPLLDRPLAPPPGWFTNLEIDLIGPHISNQLSGSVAVAGITDQVQLPTAPLDWVGSPRIEIGYRMAEGLGEFIFAYRSVVSSGKAIAVDFEGPGNDGFIRSRLNMNIFDLVYASRECSVAPLWDLNWKLGARIAGVYFDSRATGVFLQQGESSNFVGAGPIAGFEIARRFEAVPGTAAFGRMEGAALVGRVQQSFVETVDFTSVGGSLLGGAANNNSTQVVPVLAFQIGMSYAPPWDGRWTRFSVGYEFQQYWNIGQSGGSRADLQTNGVFFRAEFGF